MCEIDLLRPGGRHPRRPDRPAGSFSRRRVPLPARPLSTASTGEPRLEALLPKAVNGRGNGQGRVAWFWLETIVAYYCKARPKANGRRRYSRRLHWRATATDPHIW